MRPLLRVRRAGGAAALVTLLACTGCLTGGARARARRAAGFEVVVENHAWTDFSVWAASALGRQRLGSVGAGRTATFLVAAMGGHVSDLELFADPLASPITYRSGRLLVAEGQRVVWTVHESVLGGSVTVR